MLNEVINIPLDDIIPNRFQPREMFNETALQELSDSIKEHGVIQPIIVRQIGDKYEIIAGERRYKASTMAGLTTIPAIIRNLDDKESSKVALLENIQRKDLTPIEEARTIQKILELDQMTQEELAKTMGKSQSSIANKLRLLALTDEVQDALLNEKISERHARTLLNVESVEEQIRLLNQTIEQRLPVRELERIIQTQTPKSNHLIEPSLVDIPSIVEKKAPDLDSTMILPINDIYQEQKSEEVLEILDAMPNINYDPLIEITPIEKPVDNYQSLPTFDNLNNNYQPNNMYDLKYAINSIRQAIHNVEGFGFVIEKEELDFENSYQIIIKIDKNK
ncbi:MAG: ParB/RepB/Spo0J family partition protein [Tenericutes bacterium]|nr:ParB/RepB/Spo0J family partition protein [Mycoplasmatota bacterium]